MIKQKSSLASTLAAIFIGIVGLLIVIWIVSLFL